MSKKFFKIMVVAVTLFVVAYAYADPGKPNFGAAIYADGEVWGTKATTVLPAPNDYNIHSFDGLFIIINSNNILGQLPVGEAAPGNPDYNGGRWLTYTVEWTQEGFDYHGTVPILTSYDDILHHESLGHLIVTAGSPGPPPPNYFSCPLLPVKD
jgi:hypothetical protein